MLKLPYVEYNIADDETSTPCMLKMTLTYDDLAIDGRKRRLGLPSHGNMSKQPSTSF
jgi:hypothetical protein